MKIRNGFVSNSSTSSFVAIGFKLLEDVNNKEELAKLILNINSFDDLDEDQIYESLYGRSDDGFYIIDDAECGIAGGTYIVKDLAVTSWEGDYFESCQIEIKPLIDKLENKRKSIKLKTGPVTIYVSTRVS